MNKKPNLESFFLLNGKLENSASLWPEVGTNQELYDVFRVQQGVPLFLEEHLDRLYEGAKNLNLHIKQQPSVLLHQLRQLVSRVKNMEGNIRLSFLFAPEATWPDNYTARYIQHHYPEKSLYQTGVDCNLIPDERFRPTIKIANSTLRNRSDFLIKKEQLFETILVNREGKITEGSRSNLFFIRNQRVYTAPDHAVLSGIIRKKVIIACREQGYPLELLAIDATHDLTNMEAAFITGTSPRVLPIKKIGKQRFNPSHPIIKSLINHVNEQIAQYIIQANKNA